MSKYQRTKGHSWERKVAIDLRAIGFSKAKRHLEYQKEEIIGVDIDNSGQFAIQCKSMAKTPTMPKVFDEIKCSKEDIPVVVFKVTNKGEYACFKWEDAQVLMAWIHSFNQKGASEALV
jgi:hypothetical protein|tara:strand:- start:709 stop:1065 length:357 start_codon:yes stop_codon:yes gene_type:complete